MSPPDRQTREILEVTRDNPHLTPKEIASRVDCPRTEVTDVLQRYEDAEAIDRALERGGGRPTYAAWILAVALVAIVLGIIALSGGSDTPLPGLLLGIGLLSLAIAAHRWV